jgi:hypothetical protein
VPACALPAAGGPAVLVAAPAVIAVAPAVVGAAGVAEVGPAAAAQLGSAAESEVQTRVGAVGEACDWPGGPWWVRQ